MEAFDQRSDEILCVLSAEGDRLAEEQLVTRYNRLVRVCARPYFLAGGDSEDLIQEGMIGLLSAIRGFQPGRETSFRTYAEVCIRNRLRSAVRSAARDKHMMLNDSVALSDDAMGAVPYRGSQSEAEDPEAVLIGQEEWAGRKKALSDRLSKFERQVFALYLKGCSYEEIARQVGRPLKTVDNAVQRIRRKAEACFSSVQ